MAPPEGEEASAAAPALAKGEEAPAAGAAPTKGALRKAAKEKEKAEKAARRLEIERQQKESGSANDNAKQLYGEPTEHKDVTLTKLSSLSKESKDQTVTIQTRVHNTRAQGAKIVFLNLREGTYSIQAVIQEGEVISRQMVKYCSKLNLESIVRVTGKLIDVAENPIKSASISYLELRVESCYMVAEAPAQLPLQIMDADRELSTKKTPQVEGIETAEAPTASLETCLNYRILSIRAPTNQAIFRVNAMISELYREYMIENSFMEVETPKIVGAATEGGAGVFPVEYFGSAAYLSQSPQFYKQMCIAGDFRRVWEKGPVFRAENSNTPRHLCEFTGLDFEMEIENNWTEVIDQAEGLIGFIFRGLQEKAGYWMEVIKQQCPDAGNFKIPEAGKAPRLRFSEGIKMLKEAGIDAPEDEDISTTNEKTLGGLVREKYNTDFYFLTHYPAAARPFYTSLSPGEEHLTNSYDAFMRGQEIVSGAQRINDIEKLNLRMKSLGLDPENEGYRYYRDAFRNGCAPHGGGGFGLNRITMLWLGLGNIREATLFPRDPGRKAP